MSFPTTYEGQALFGSATSVAKPNDMSTFSFIPIGPEFVAGFDGNATSSNLTKYFQQARGMRYYKDIADGWANGDFRGAMEHIFDRGGSYSNDPTPRLGNVYEEVNPAGGKIVPYDLYTSYAPLSDPMGEPFNFLFTEAVSEDETTYGTGSRCVGISAVSQKIQKPGGGSINIDLAETFGLNGTPLDFTKLVFGLNRRVYIPSYGSQSSAIYSMGGTALHCMVWDDWPAQLTVFVPQYFCVMHFNPGVLGDTCGRLDYNIDFYEPSDGDGTVVGPADSVSLSVNNSRRGQMVTGGFKYYQKSIGYSLGSYDIEFAGRNFLVGDLAYDRGNGSIIEVTSVDGNGGITGFSFSTDEEGNLTRGEFLSPEVLEAPVIYSSNNSTASARIKFNQGIITKYTKVEGPRQRVSVRRLSTTADGTLGRVYGTKNNTIALPQNNDAPEPGSYQIFYLFHSDAMVNPRVDGVDNKGIVQIAHITVTVT